MGASSGSSGDAGCLAAASLDGLIYKVGEGGVVTESVKLPDKITDFHIAGDDVYVVRNSEEFVHFRWPTKDAVSVLHHSEEGIVSASFSSSSKQTALLLLAVSGHILLLELSSKQVLQRYVGYDPGHRPPITRAVFGGHQDEFVAIGGGGGGEGKICIWQRSSGSLIKMLAGGHDGIAGCVAWNSNNKNPILASGGDDKKIW